jgi:PAS domain S-box-containing protein
VNRAVPPEGPPAPPDRPAPPLNGLVEVDRGRMEEERERWAARLRDSAAEANRHRAQLEAVFQAMRDGVMVFDMEGNTVFANEAQARILGIERSRDLERDLAYYVASYETFALDRGVVPVEDWPVSRVLRGESLAEREIWCRRKDTGHEQLLSFAGEPVWDEQGKQILAVLVIRDVTERKAADAERDRLLLALQEADRRKDELLAMLSHELRNPLAPIRNSLYLLDRSVPQGSRVKRALAVIDRQVAHMSRLIEDLVDVTRITKGKIVLDRARIDLKEVVRRTVEDHRSIFVHGAVELHVTLAPGPVWVNGDATRLAQAFGNLLQNAAKFTPPGGAAHVDLELLPGDRAVLRVRDTGQGIAASMLPNLFSPFVQAESTPDRRMGGLGLGLSLVKGIVELHGGDVTVESGGQGKGATFSLQFPLDMTPGEPALEDAAPTTHHQRRVLVIEDNVDAAETLRDVLEMEGHTVEVAYAGDAGLERALAFRPDAVLCDIGLPEMDGYEVARALRADPGIGRRTTLVALTGYARREDIAKARAAGFDAHLAKPPTLEQIAELLEALPRRL